MKGLKKDLEVSTASYILTCLLFGGFLCCCNAQVNITQPPANKTVCRDNDIDVTISCGYQSDTVFPVTWIINGTSFTQEQIMNNSSFQLNYPTNPPYLSLTVFSINDTTTFQCIIQSTPNATASTLGTVNVTAPLIRIISLRVGCGYVYVSWISGNSEICKFLNSAVRLRDFNYQYQHTSFTPYNFTKITGVPSDTLLNVTIFVTTTNSLYVEGSPSISTLVRTEYMQSPTPVRVTADAYVDLSTYKIRVSWEAPPITASCVAKVTDYKITVMDQYRPASVTVPEYHFSTILSRLPNNGTSIVANREYTITVSAISDQRKKYPSDPVVVNTFILRNCTVTSPSIGIIRVSCDIHHEIQVTATCTFSNNCDNSMVTVIGNSPIVVAGLDPGIMYSVTVDVFNDNQVGLPGQTVTRDIEVNSNSASSDNDSGDISTEAIVGIVIGGVAILTLIIIIIVAVPCYVLYKKRSALTVYDDDDKTSLQRSPMLLETSKSY